MSGDRNGGDDPRDWDLPEQTADDRDVGWGEDLAGGDGAADADDDRLLADRPPHHEDRAED